MPWQPWLRWPTRLLQAFGRTVVIPTLPRRMAIASRAPRANAPPRVRPRRGPQAWRWPHVSGAESEGSGKPVPADFNIGAHPHRSRGIEPEPFACTSGLISDRLTSGRVMGDAPAQHPIQTVTPHGSHKSNAVVKRPLASPCYPFGPTALATPSCLLALRLAVRRRRQARPHLLRCGWASGMGAAKYVRPAPNHSSNTADGTADRQHDQRQSRTTLGTTPHSHVVTILGRWRLGNLIYPVRNCKRPRRQGLRTCMRLVRAHTATTIAAPRLPRLAPPLPPQSETEAPQQETYLDVS